MDNIFTDVSLFEAVKKIKELNAYEAKAVCGRSSVSFFHGQWYVDGKEAESVPFNLVTSDGWTLYVQAATIEGKNERWDLPFRVHVP